MADKLKLKAKRLERRKYGIRKNLAGTAERPRLTVFRSGLHIEAQVIDDLTGKTLASASSKQESFGLKHGANLAAAKTIGTAIAKKAIEAGVKQVAFDRNGRQYHGRVKALADAAREGGLKF
ncbi:MAG: 50S ribosomal protein L18 [Tepidisphaeraceae bacterium]